MRGRVFFLALVAFLLAPAAFGQTPAPLSDVPDPVALGLGDKDVSLVAELDAVIGAEATKEADEQPFDRLLEVAKARLALRRRGEEPGPLPTKTKELVG